MNHLRALDPGLLLKNTHRYSTTCATDPAILSTQSDNKNKYIIFFIISRFTMHFQPNDNRVNIYLIK